MRLCTRWTGSLKLSSRLAEFKISWCAMKFKNIKNKNFNNRMISIKLQIKTRSVLKETSPGDSLLTKRMLRERISMSWRKKRRRKRKRRRERSSRKSRKNLSRRHLSKTLSLSKTLTFQLRKANLLQLLETLAQEKLVCLRLCSTKWSMYKKIPSKKSLVKMQTSRPSQMRYNALF